jgi:hypothetical protein
VKLAVNIGYTLAAVALAGLGMEAQSAEYCCVCQGQTAGKTIQAFSRGIAIAQCSLECEGYTNVASGKCAPAAAAPAPAPAAPPAAATEPPTPSAGVVLVYKSEDCSGDALQLSGSVGELGAGLRSFRVESGPAASAWEQAGYAGRHTEPVGPSICLSPGFDVRSIRLQ